MPDEPVHKSQYRGDLIQCANCHRVVGADQVNSNKRCAICSPPRDHGEPDEEVAAE